MDKTADMIQHLLGQNGIAKVTLVTTKWIKNPAEGTRSREELREQELQNDHWAWQSKCNSRVTRFDGMLPTALGIIRDLTGPSRYDLDQSDVDFLYKSR